MGRFKVLTLALSAGGLLAFVALASAGGPPPPNDNGANADKVAVCHKPGTPAEKTLYVPANAVGAHLGHGDTAGECGAPPPAQGCDDAAFDLCIDGDGFASPQPGGFEVEVGDPLATVPGFNNGLDLFDRAPMGVLDQNDDFHAESSTICPTAARNAVYDDNALFQDCVILDIDGSLTNGEPVSADCDGGGCYFLFRLAYHDRNGDGNYDPDIGEDLVRDTNANLIFD